MRKGLDFRPWADISKKEGLREAKKRGRVWRDEIKMESSGETDKRGRAWRVRRRTEERLMKEGEFEK